MADTEVEALLIERAGYLARERTDRVAQVDAALAAHGVKADDAPERATAEPEVETATPARARRRKATD